MAKRKMTDREKWDEMDKAIANSPEYKRFIKALGGEETLEKMLEDTRKRLIAEGGIKEGE